MSEDHTPRNPTGADLADMLLSDLAEARLEGHDPVDVILRRARIRFPTPYLRFCLSKAVLSERNARAVAARRCLKARPSSPGYEQAKRRFEALARSHNAAMSLYDDWIVDGTPLGDVTRHDLEAAASRAAARADGLARNARFYAALRLRLGASNGRLRDVVSEAEAEILRDEVFR